MSGLAPKLRFKQDDGSDFPTWEIRPLSKVADINPKVKTLPCIFNYIDLESVKKGSLQSYEQVQKDGAPSRAQRLLKKNDILFQTVRPYQKNNLHFSLDGSFVASTGFAQLRAKDSVSFLYQALHHERFVSSVLKACTGTSYPAINSSDLGNLELFFPSLPEQQKIADFLSSVDAKIDAVKRKLDAFERYKKGLMQLIFAQKIRFKQEDGSDFPEWEEKRLGDVGKLQSGVAFPDAEQGGNEGTAFYKVSDMNLRGNETQMKTANNYVSNEQISRLRYKPIKTKAIIFAKVGAAIFLERKRLAENFLIDNNMMSFSPSQLFDISYAMHLFQKLRLAKYAQVGALPSFNSSDVAIIKIQLPSLPEQQKIADFLSAIDAKINAIKIQIQKLETFKKGLLQQMFV